ncbi:hypothetical protein CCR75_004474 [Bremia lactucae]|uniref:Uncharacterized protein n=1 Tax=Bremia lactucae TaxID=4779 RepID=A0A976IDG5_BRELC|nr:hypothetical protein CCR75_004474 [Bremia lactucae]
MNDLSSGVFCGDLHAPAETQPCCCPYFTECLVNGMTSSCKCAGPSFQERVSETKSADDTEPLRRKHVTLKMDDPMENQMSISTEILIHLSAYLALVVIAVYVDHWVECFRDVRRNQMVTYSESVEVKLLRFRQRFGLRLSESQTNTKSEDDRPLLASESRCGFNSNFDCTDVEENYVRNNADKATCPIDAL